MTRLRSLIKEVLSQPKKKDCNCGCNDCGSKAPILTEGKVKHLISEGLQYHMDKKIQLHESVYRIGSEKHFELIREARALWVRGIIDVSEDDQAILETNLGHFGMYEGEEVPLDMPMVNESTFQGNEIAIYDGEDGETYIEKRGTGYYGYNNSFDFTAKDKAELEQKLNMWGYYPIAGSINEEKAITFRPGTLSDMELATKILDKEGIEYKIDNFDLILSDEDYLVVLDYLKGGNNVNVNLSTSILNEGGADTAWEDEEGNKVTLQDILDMTKNIPQKDYPTEKLAKVVLNWDDNPEEVERIEQVEVSKQYPILIMVDEAGKIQWILDGNHRVQKALRSKAETIPAKLIRPSMLNAKAKKVLLGVVDESLNEVDRYSGFNRNPEDPDSVPFEPTGAVAQFKEDLRALFSKFKGDLKNPEFIKGVAEIMVNWKSLLRSQLDENRNTKYTKVLTKIFRKEYEVFPFDYYQDGAKIVITPEGYNPDGTLFDMKDDWREDIIRVVRKYKPKWHIGPNMGGGLTIHFDESIDPIDKELLEEAKKKKKKKKKKKDPPLNKPKRGGSKAYYVYVRDPKTKKIVKVSFGSGGLRAKIKDKEKRNAFAARHNCKNKKDRTSPGYWSCNLPRYAEQLGLGSNMNTFW